MNKKDTCIAINCPDSYREKSASGGVFPYIAKQVLQSGGYVVGALYDDSHTKVYHAVTNQWSVVQLMRSSKYVHSNATKLFSKIAELLQQDKTVLFTGCACQCAVLKSYLKGKVSLNKLITIDVICYGTPEPSVYASYINSLTTQFGPIYDVDFRRKSEFGWDCGFFVEFASKKTISEGAENPYLKGFLDGYIMCSFCHNCRFKSAKYSDLTIGDFWGIETANPDLADGKGTSLIEINTPRGQALFDQMLGDIPTQSVHPIEPAIANNLALRQPMPEHPQRKRFFELFKTRKNDVVFWEMVKKEFK